MRKLVLCLYLILFSSIVFAQLSDKQHTKALKFIKDEALPINLDSGKTFLKDINKLKKYIGNSSIVLLGEETHGDGTAFKTKAELVKLLHKELGFSVIALESSMFLAEKSFEKAQKQQDGKLTIRSSSSPIWTWSIEVQPLVNYIDQQKNSSNPLYLTGFDYNEFSQMDRETFPIELLKAMNKNHISFLNKEEQNSFLIFYALLANQFSERTEQMSVDYLKSLLKTFNVAGYRILGELRLLKGTDIELLAQNLINKLNVSNNLVNKELKETNSKFNEYLRDSIMAANIIWLKEKRYPNQKIIVWAANLHNAKKVGAPYRRLMGDFLYEKYPKEIYSIAFVANKGEIGNFTWDGNRELSPATPNMLEHLFSSTNIDNFLLDFKTLKGTRKGKWLDSEQTMRPFGYIEQTKNWTNIFDAIIFNDQMEKVHIFKTN